MLFNPFPSFRHVTMDYVLFVLFEAVTDLLFLQPMTMSGVHRQRRRRRSTKLAVNDRTRLVNCSENICWRVTKCSELHAQPVM